MRHRSVTHSGAAGQSRPAEFARLARQAGSSIPDSAFHALSDPTRRAVLDLLRAGMRPAGEIARAFPVSRPAISKHLRVLRRAHLVEERKEGRHRLYQLNPEPLKAVDSWLDQYRRFWTANLESLKSFVEGEYQKELSADHSSDQKSSDTSTEKIQSRRKDT
jgi:DNA-binding transcriptional ArsR family regulator